MPIPSSSKPAVAKRTLLRDTVFERLREAILDGTLQPGERLHDDEIEEWLGVSRTPVRDALNELSRAGLVEMSPNRYTRVVVPVEEEATDALQTLGVILGGVVRLAAPRLKGEAREQILAQFGAVDECLRADDSIATNIAAVKLWRMIAQECGNPILLHLCEQTIDGLAYKLRIAAVNRVFDMENQSQMFTDVADRMAAGDGIGAELAVEKLHLLPEGDHRGESV